jgi:formylglycine-generating enzyme required for sulfatase activity
MEWCRDSYSRDLARVPQDGAARLDTNSRFRVVRGSAWSSSRSEVRVTLRLGKNRSLGYENVGFRLARDL